MIPNLKIDYVVLNAGVLRYPNVSPLPKVPAYPRTKKEPY
jgi:hypothetical protein